MGERGDRVGEQVGNYQLLRYLDQGSFAQVYQGEHRYLEFPVAIKLLHVRMQPETHAAFQREARTIAHLQHPHIIEVRDYGIEDQTPYLVMDYLPGGTLRDRHPRGTRLTYEQIISYVKQIASALDYAHEQHVIHRDVKPENLLLNAKGEVVLSDFGIAVIERSLESLSSQNGAGTPLYMAPEQIRYHPCPQSDQYALGVMVYEWLCGEPPFRGPGAAIFGQHLHQVPPSLCARLPGLSPVIEDAVLGALAKRPEERFVSVQDFATVLEEACFSTQPLLLQGDEPPTPSRMMPPALTYAEARQEEVVVVPQPALAALPQVASVAVEVPPGSAWPETRSETTSKRMRPSLEQVNRQRLLRKVRSFWITGVLEHSLHGAALMALGLQKSPDAVANPWHLVLQHPDTVPQALPAGTRITQVYDEADGELLILGAPGSGKTTLLLELARDLLERAEQDAEHPMPVVFNLSSWSIKQQALVDWLVEELQQRYQVPRTLGQRLVEAGTILPLLDGLDEMESTSRSPCIEAINSYRDIHGLQPLVVCSRSADYLAQSRRVRLSNAVAVQSLSREQIEDYLVHGGESLWALRVALQQDAVLRELISTPLMLSIMTLTYQGKPVEELLHGPSLQERQRHLFQHYVERMLTRRGPLKAGTPQQVGAWLSFLAARMRERNQSVFYLEQLQPNWLPPIQHCSYVLLAVRLPAVFIGILTSLSAPLLFFYSLHDPISLIQYGVLGGLLGWLFSRPISARESLLQETGDHRGQGRKYVLKRDLPLSIIVGLLITGLSLVWRASSFNVFRYSLRQISIYGVVIGFSCLLLGWLISLPLSSPKNNKLVSPWNVLLPFIRTIHGRRAWLVFAILGLSFGLSHGLSYGLSSGLSFGLPFGLIIGLSFGLISALVSLILGTQAEDIFLTERLQWTWKSLIRSLLTPTHVKTTLLIGSATAVTIFLSYELQSIVSVVMHVVPRIGLSDDLSVGLSFGLSSGLSSGLLYWILLGLFQGVSNERIEDRTRRVPNQGIRDSLHNSLLMAVIGGGIIGIVSMLSYMLYIGLLSSLLIFFRNSQGFPLITLLKFDLFFGLHDGWRISLYGGLLVGSMTGGVAAWRHGIIRLLLRRVGAFPPHYVRFLDEAADCLLLQKVGGGYIFAHRLLLEYCASLERTTQTGKRA